MLDKIRSHFYCATTNYIDKKASEIMLIDDPALDPKCALDRKRAQFKIEINSYYKSRAGELDSDELIVRLSEIDSYERFNRNVLIPAVLGACLGLIMPEIVSVTKSIHGYPVNSASKSCL